MKKLLTLSAIALLAFVQQSDAGMLYTRKKNGGPDGYSSVRFIRTPLGDYLSCRNSGFEPCAAPEPNAAEAALSSQVDAAISSGILTGTITQGSFTATWNGTDVYNVDIDLEEPQIIS